MGNLFLNIPVPAGNGTGAAVETSQMASTKTIVCGGPFVATVNLEISNDAGALVWAPLATFQRSGNLTVSVSARFMRASVSDYKSGVANLDVSAAAVGDASFVLLPGNGTPVDISAAPLFKTVVAPGSFTGNVEISGDGVSYAQIWSLQDGGQQSREVVGKFARAIGSGEDVYLGGTSNGSGGIGTISWAPGGGGDATTWAEVMAFVTAVNHPLAVYLNGSASIPPGVYDVNGMQLISDPEIETFVVTMDDGAQLYNLAAILGQITLKSLSTALTPLEFGAPPSGAPHSLKLEFNASLENAGTVPMVEVAAGEILVIAGLFNATLTDTAPVVNLGAGSTLIVGVYGALNVTDDYVTGPASATLVYQVVTGGLPTPLPTNAGFAGTTLQNVLTGWSCTTAGRPSSNPLYTLHTGTMTFDIDLGLPIWWDGTQWVDATGTPA